MTKPTPHPGPDHPPRRWILALAAIQAGLLVWLYQAAAAEAWPSASPFWLFPLLALTIALPVTLQLAVREGRLSRLLLPSLLLAAALLGTAFYMGWQAEPGDEIPRWPLTSVFAFSTAVAIFKVTMYLQHYVAGEPLGYRRLLVYSWRNFLTVALALAFVAAAAAVLALWAALFAVIGIPLFAELFSKPWFFLPVAALAFGLGVGVFRSLTGVIDGISGLLEGLIRLLLPLLVGVTLLFLGALALTGLSPLWDTGSGTALLLWLTALLLFFVNAVYRAGDEPVAYPPWVQLLVCLGVAATPLLCALSFYGLWLRVDQYGLTVERCWGLLVWALLTAFSLGYTWGVARRGLAWPRTLAAVNTGMGLAVLALMLLVSTPLLDFRKLSLASQVARVERGGITWQNFDFLYARRALGRPGYRFLEELREREPQLAALIDATKAMPAASQGPEADWAAVVYRPEPFEVPPEVREQLEPRLRVPGTELLVLLKVDLDQDGAEEYALLVCREGGLWGHLMFAENRQWRGRRLLGEVGDDAFLPRSRSGGRSYRAGEGCGDLVGGEIRVVMPRFGALEVDGARLEVR